MRIPRTLALLVVAVGLSPSRTPAQQIGISIHLGPPQVVAVYEAETYGPWRTSYMEWEPIRLYFVDGVYYERPARGARVVMVYRRGRDYFLPPRDVAWIGVDRRYEYKYKPRKWDYEHGKSRGRGRGRGHEKHDPGLSL